MEGIRYAYFGNNLKIHWYIDTTGHQSYPTSLELLQGYQHSMFLTFLCIWLCPCGRREGRRGFTDSVNVPMNA